MAKAPTIYSGSANSLPNFTQCNPLTASWVSMLTQERLGSGSRPTWMAWFNPSPPKGQGEGTNQPPWPSSQQFLVAPPTVSQISPTATQLLPVESMFTQKRAKTIASHEWHCSFPLPQWVKSMEHDSHHGQAPTISSGTPNCLTTFHPVQPSHCLCGVNVHPRRGAKQEPHMDCMVNSLYPNGGR